MIDSKILALKYRPQEFNDLIGQEIMARTITNAIKFGKTPNAYLLTGIRGVGKTTTARLIAKALNCLKNLDKKINCTSENFCSSCKEIVSSNHIDILEMDAASKTGIDDVRELIENSKYSPTSAKYKIFIIDEVHMLSKQAFNGLLKTLEEPPPSLKFILATTEVRKIPVTVLSRCQRFDLKRVGLNKIKDHIKYISKKEQGKISDNALEVIARASEGSVRDAISLLDRALIVQTINDGKEVQDQDIRSMLGLADRSKLIMLFKEILEGNEKKAISLLRDLIDSGLDSKIFLNDFLEILYLFSRRINLGPIEKDLMIADPEIEMIDRYSKSIDMQDIGIFWQLTIKTINDLKLMANENLALEMYVMQLVHLKDIVKESHATTNIGQSKNAIIDQKITVENKKSKSEATNQLKNINQIKIDNLKDNEKKNDEVKNNINSFQDLINITEREKEVELKYDLERNVNLVSFKEGKIDIRFNERLNKNFIKIFTEKLMIWTGKRWIISFSQKDGKKTVYETNIETKHQELTKIKESIKVKNIMSSFPDAKLINVNKKTNKDD